MNQSQIYTLAKNAGLTEARARTAAAIAMAESGGNEKAEVHDSDDDSYGLWQINYKGSLKVARTAQFGPGSGLLNGAKNAQAMSTISHQGQNFTPWTTYTSGKYKTFLSNTVNAVDVTPGGVASNLLLNSSNLVTNPLGTIKDTADAARTTAAIFIRGAEWFANPKNWIRVTYVMAGSIVAIAGLITIVKSTEAGQAAGVAAKKTGAAIKKAGTTAAKVAATA